MSTLTLSAILIIALFLSWTTWFVIEFIRYLVTGEYEVDQRLRDISR